MCKPCANYLVMSRKKKDSTIAVIDRVYLKKNAASPFYQYYFRLNNCAVRASTQTDNVQKASDIALAAYYRCRENRAAQKQKKTSFTQIAESYLQQIQHEKKYKFHFEQAHRYFIPFFSKFKDIREITASDIDEYLLHRKKKSKKMPKPQTVNKENVVLRQILNHAYPLRNSCLIPNQDSLLGENSFGNFSVFLVT